MPIRLSGRDPDGRTDEHQLLDDGNVLGVGQKSHPIFRGGGLRLVRFDLRSALHAQGEFKRILDSLQEAQRVAEVLGDQPWRRLIT